MQTMTGEQLTARDAKVLDILRAHVLVNENGERIMDFATQGRDCLDFTSLSKAKLRRMLNDAYRAGRESHLTEY